MIQCKKTAEINDLTRHHGVITGNHDVTSVKINTTNRLIDAQFWLKTYFGIDVIRFIYKETFC